jgi:transcriptional regulator with PAS, ATPase and Fis domain
MGKAIQLDIQTRIELEDNSRAFRTTILELERQIRIAFKLFKGTNKVLGLPIILGGESGTGKTLLAKDFHTKSECSGSFLPVHCPNFANHLFEAELFGSKKGSYTGSESTREGVLQQAHNGVIFLDEVGDLPLEYQAKLLRVIETGRYKRVGEDHERSLEAQWIAATNKDLKVMVENGTFRSDLYYRLHGHQITIPALRNRRQDLGILIESILSECKTSSAQLTDEAFDMLLSHSWPGNIRELKSVLNKAVILADDDPIAEEHIMIDKVSELNSGDEMDCGIRVGMSLSEVRKRVISQTLKVTGNQSKAAEMLGIGRSGLSRALSKA